MEKVFLQPEPGLAFHTRAMKTTLPDLVHCIGRTGDKCMLKLGSRCGPYGKTQVDSEERLNLVAFHIIEL